ncbi:MAG TPA: NUDIX hydrolase [Bacteroidia bacterium]|jgi:ADP-ribose pyrophosphatase YjhB (NUDIX family)|nr:NUDIX hydrolase [Bacteroidia bacterium]
MKLNCFALIENDDHYLLIRETNPKWKSKWFLPGGETKRNESPEQAILRETRNEASCEINVKGMFYSKYYRGLLINKLSFYYYAEAINKEIKKFPDICSQKIKWFKYEEILALPLRDNVIDIINTYRNLKKNHSLKLNTAENEVKVLGVFH